MKPARFLVFGCLLFLSCRSATIPYETIPVPDRRMNMSGLVAVATDYLNTHPGDFHKFHRILVAADDALQRHERLTRAGVMRWIRRALEAEGYAEEMPVYLFVQTVYLEGWERERWNFVDQSEREYLYDLISAAMGGMHLCETCSTEVK